MYMKHKITFFLFLSLFSFGFIDDKTGNISNSASHDLTDTIPQVCAYITPRDMETCHPFTTLLTNTFPDPNSFETYAGCHYQFFTRDEYPQIAVRLIKWSSKQEAANEFKQQVQSHFDQWGIAPERLRGTADSAYFGFNTEDTSLCDECGLVAIQGEYAMYISFKGQYEKVPRARKKQSALKILQMMYDRIPGLTPPRVRIW